MRRQSLVAPARFHLLNTHFDLDASGWDPPAVDRLLRYNLHYFDDVNARDAAVREHLHLALIERWINENPPGAGTAWEPYPISLRIGNWIKWLIRRGASEPSIVASLAVQARWLRARLETHLLGNHLFANAKALTLAGLFFSGAEADDWSQCGLAIVARELEEQILADGGHFERSPMYHALALEDVLDLVNVLAVYSCLPSTALRESAGRMLRWLRHMTHPNGELASFNDSANGIAPDLHELERYAGELGISAPRPLDVGVTHLPDSGYIRVANERAIALLDVAPVGPDYLAAHGHADTLSFELSLDGRRLVVNGGTSCYGIGAQRLHERGTAAHSTVQLAGLDSSEVWSGFRLGRRARPFRVQITSEMICGSHDGYRFLPGKPTHRRCWCLEKDQLTIEDTVTPDRYVAVARYILAPGSSLIQLDPGLWEVRQEARAVIRIQVIKGKAAIETTHHAPEFGMLLPASCLSVTLEKGQATTRWLWSGM
jgi:uncharacterized heparinase superfamily protein